MSREIELRRHTDADGDVLTAEGGAAAALEIGARLQGGYDLALLPRRLQLRARCLSVPTGFVSRRGSEQAAPTWRSVIAARCAHAGRTHRRRGAHELKALEQLERAATSRPAAAAVVGQPGIGKSRLLAEAPDRMSLPTDLPRRWP